MDSVFSPVGSSSEFSCRKIWVGGRPLCFGYVATQFVFTDLWSDTVFLCLDANRACNIPGDTPAVFQGRKQRRGRIFEGGRIRGKRASCSLQHCVGDPASAGSDKGKAHCWENMNVVALRDSDLAAVVADRCKWRTRRDQRTSVSPTNQILCRCFGV